MDKLIKERWLVALRSGKYRRTSDRFEDASGALDAVGVLCKLLGVREIYRRNTGYILAECRKACGICVFDMRALIKRSISLEETFDEIADWIEENVE